MIEAHDLHKYYGPVAAVAGVSFQIEAGEVVGFLGPNGAGKTTTLRILTGATTASRGYAKIAGFHVEDHPLEVKRRVGYLPESMPLYPEMAVGAFLRYVAAVKGVPRGKRVGAVGDVMARCGLDAMEKRVLRNLSKGYRQRVGLAQALINDPPVLILDEPTEGLDPRQIIGIRQLIRDLARDHTVLLSTHILPEAALVCSRILIIHKGRIVSHGLPTGEADMLDIEVDGPSDAVMARLRSVPDVLEVSQEGAGRYAVRVRTGHDMRRAIVSAVAEAGFGLLGLRVRVRALEDVFVEVVASDDDARAGAASEGER